MSEVPAMECVAVPESGASGLADRERLAATERYAREAWLAMANREYGRARNAIAKCEREDVIAEMIDQRTPLAEILANSGRWVRVINAYEDVGVCTVEDLLASPATLLMGVPGVSPATAIEVLKAVLGRVVKREE